MRRLLAIAALLTTLPLLLAVQQSESDGGMPDDPVRAMESHTNPPILLGKGSFKLWKGPRHLGSDGNYREPAPAKKYNIIDARTGMCKNYYLDRAFFGCGAEVALGFRRDGNDLIPYELPEGFRIVGQDNNTNTTRQLTVALEGHDIPEITLTQTVGSTTVECRLMRARQGENDQYPTDFDIFNDNNELKITNPNGDVELEHVLLYTRKKCGE